MRMSVVEHDLSADKLDFLKAVGINHVCGDGPSGYGFDRLGYWDAEVLEDTRKRCEAHGIKLQMLTLPLNSVSVDRSAPSGTKSRVGPRMFIESRLMSAAVLLRGTTG